MRVVRRLVIFIVLTLVLLVLSLPARAASRDWVSSIRQTVVKIDAGTPGNMGVFIKRLSDGTQLSYQADRSWYLASTTKVPLAITLLQKVEDGSISLAQELILRESDYVDGAGVLLSLEAGARLSVSQLLEAMIAQSDSTATDMLIRLIGVDQLNAQVQKKIASREFGPITPLLQVRYDAYGELHSKAQRLTNLDFIDFKRFKDLKSRLQAFLSKLGLAASMLKAQTIDEAFERYYKRGFNSAKLDAFGLLLERLVRGELLSKKNTDLILALMEKTITGEHRIKAGLFTGARFAQKTGTQVRRICNVGVIRSRSAKSDAVVVAACMEKFQDPVQAEAAMRRLGLALSESAVLRE